MITLQGQVVDGLHDSYEVGERIELQAGNSSLFWIEGREDLLFKQFRKPARGKVELERLTELTEIGIEVARARGKAAAIRRIAWPRDLVVAGDAVTAVVLPYAGESYFRLQTQKDVVLPRDLSYLRRDEEGVDDLVRLILLRQLAGVMGALEHANLVHGDIARQNMLWAPPPNPSLMLVDCDGLHRESSGGTRARTKAWADPRLLEDLIEVHDMKSDWYALALAVWQTMARTAAAPPRRDGRLDLPRGIPARIRETLELAFTDPLDAYSRPSPEDWAKTLDAEIKGRGGRARARRVEKVMSVPQPVVARPRQKRASSSPRPPVTSTPMPGRPPRRRRRGRKLLLAALVGLAILLAASFLGDGPRGPQQRAETAVAQWSRSKLATRGVLAHCPEKATLHAGARYVCSVETKRGAVARVRVKIGAERGMRRHLNLIAYRRRAVLDDIRAAYGNRSRHGGRELTEISCRPTFSARPGTSIRCGATFSDGRGARIAVRMRTRRLYAWHELGSSIGGRGSALR